MQGYIDPFAHRRISDREDDDGEEVDGGVDGEGQASALPDHDDRDVVVEPDRVDQFPLDTRDDLIRG
jgi:hypothetical protein